MSEEIREDAVVETVVETPVVETPIAAEVVEAPAVEEAAVEAPAADVVETVETTTEQKDGKGIGVTSTGAIASGTVKASKPRKEKLVEQPVILETVAVKSNRNISWSEVGRLVKGINIVSKADSEKWITLNGVEIVSPEDVAKEFDK